ncbi:MAG: hypothetical protein C9356_09220 [Oleiphilus sp.]|nr:MAG: hypothetical protein C9356_09220 [Oleiphilus sp.]
MSIMHPNLKTRKTLGAYYTPDNLCDLLTRFAIQSKSDEILEPSFGGCGLLRSSYARLKNLGHPKPANRVYGCDIDHHAFDILGKELLLQTKTLPNRNYIHSDFLSPDLRFDGKKFNAIVGNPPYIGYGSLSSYQRDWGRKIVQDLAIRDSRYAGSWFYFVLKSLTMLAPNGRVAFVLPYALINADYARHLRQIISGSFSESTIYALNEKLFLTQGTKERVVLLLAKDWRGFAESERQINTKYLNSVEEIEQDLNKSCFGRISIVDSELSSNVFDNRIGYEGAEALAILDRNNCSIELGSILRVKIGLVAGNSNFFTFNRKRLSEVGLSADRHCVPILRSLKGFQGICYGWKEFRDEVNKNADCYLLDFKQEFLNEGAYQEYLSTMSNQDIERNQTFAKRPLWYKVSDDNVPDVFLAYMNIHGPRLIVNQGNYECLNNIHRGYFKSRYSKKQTKLVAISLLTSYTQIVAELTSKQYGSKSLKLEPSTYTSLPILLPDESDDSSVTKQFNLVNRLLKSGRTMAACAAASEYIYKRVLSKHQMDRLSPVLENSLAQLRDYRNSC